MRTSKSSGSARARWAGSRSSVSRWPSSTSIADGRFVARDWARSRGFRSLYAAPLLDQGRLLGVLVLIGEQPFRFSPDDEDLLQSFSAQAAAAIRNARLYEETRRYADRLRALEEVNRLVSSSLNVEEVLQNLARAIAQFFDAPFVSIWAFDAGAQRLRRALTFGDLELAAELHDDLALGEGAVGWVVQHREPIMWTEAATDPRFVDVPPLSARGLRWMTVYPIAIGDRMLGAFAVHRAATWPITPETSSLMGSLAAQAAIAPRERAPLFGDEPPVDRDARAARGGRDPQLHPGIAHACSSGSRSRWPRCAASTAARSSCGTATRWSRSCRSSPTAAGCLACGRSSATGRAPRRRPFRPTPR